MYVHPGLGHLPEEILEMILMDAAVKMAMNGSDSSWQVPQELSLVSAKWHRITSGALFGRRFRRRLDLISEI
jgi:hypothetical protein